MKTAKEDTPLEKEILELVRHGLRDRLPAVSEDAEERLDPQWIAESMLDAIPTRHPFEDLGPFYDTAGLCRWLGLTRQAVNKRVQQRKLLATRTGDGTLVYPAWQFMPGGQVASGLPEVLDVLLGAIDPWTAAIWLTTESDHFGGKSAIEYLVSMAPRRGPVEEVVRAAAEDVERWQE